MNYWWPLFPENSNLRFVDVSCQEIMLHYQLCVRIFRSGYIIIYVCKYDNALCTDKSASASFMYAQTVKIKEQMNIKGNKNEQTNE